MHKVSEYATLFVVGCVTAAGCTALALNNSGVEVVFLAILAINSAILALIAAIAHFQGLSYRTGN